jgi:hypothetical protein
LIAAYLCRDLGAAEQAMKGDIFSLLDDGQFRQLDKSGYHPAYLIGAALIDYFMNRLSQKDFKEFWNLFGSASSDSERKKLILTKASENDLRKHSEIYFASLRQQAELRSRRSCPE